MLRRAGYALGMLATCWLGMMLVHECGHMLAAVCTGGGVARLEWPLLGFSRTEVAPNPHPAVVAWAGPLLGAILPAGLWALLRGMRRACVSVQIFAGFCLVANGAYLSLGTFDRAGDVDDILRQGGAAWTLWVAGAALVVGGFAVWHALGPGFGIRKVGPREMMIAGLLGGALVVTSGLSQYLM